MILVGLLLLIGGIIALKQLSNDVEYSNNLPCYDKFENKIQGVKCSGEIVSDETTLLASILFLMAFMGMILFPIGLVVYITGDED